MTDVKAVKKFQWIDLAILNNNPSINTDHVRHYADAAVRAINVFYDVHNPDRIVVHPTPTLVRVLSLIARRCGYKARMPKQNNGTLCPTCHQTRLGGRPVYVEVHADVVLGALNLLEDIEEE